MKAKWKAHGGGIETSWASCTVRKKFMGLLGFAMGWTDGIDLAQRVGWFRITGVGYPGAMRAAWKA